MLLIGGLALVAQSSVKAASVVLAWNSSTNANVTAYTIYYGTTHNYDKTVPLGNVTTGTVPGLLAGTTYYFAAKATDNTGSDSDFSNETTYTIPAGSTNAAPTLNPINNLTLIEDAGAQTINLSGISSGSVNETQTLTVTATSSDANLIPNLSVNYTSPNTSGTLVFSPSANNTGTATITVTVNDGQAANNTITRTFTVTVNPLNDPPTLNALANLTLNANAPAQTVNLRASVPGPPMKTIRSRLRPSPATRA